jgi:tetratricopeptide (TPR) repeat protein
MKLFLLFLLVILSASCKNYDKITQENRILLDKGQNKDVIENLSPILEENKDFADGFNLRGIAFLNTDNAEKALADFNQAIKIDNQNYKFYYNRGNVYRRILKIEDALKDYEKGIELNPNIADLYINKGAVLFEMQRYKEALASLNKAISINPSDKNALFNRGEVYFKEGNFEKAIADLHHCVELAPDFSKAHYVLAMSEIMQNNDKNTPESCQHLQKSAELGYEVASKMLQKYCQ